MLENLSSLFYVLGRELFIIYFFCYIFLGHLNIPRKLFYAILASAIIFEWCYLLYCNNQLTVAGQYLASLQYVIIGLCCFKQDFIKRLFLILLLANTSFLTQTLALVIMEQCPTALPPITLGAIVLMCSNLALTPLSLKFLNIYKDTLLQSKNTYLMNIASLILFLNLLGTVALYNFQDPRDWHLFWGRFFNIIPSIIFVQIIIYLLRELELHSNLKAKIQYIEQLRSSEQEHFNHILEIWRETRRLRHDIRHRTLILRDYLISGQYDSLRQELVSLYQQSFDSESHSFNKKL